jgi:hypothetical protein
VHQRRLASAVVADEADALFGMDGEIHTVKGVDGAEMLFDAVQPDDGACACLSHQRSCLPDNNKAGAKRPRNHFMLALIAAAASACVYS